MTNATPRPALVSLLDSHSDPRTNILNGARVIDEGTYLNERARMCFWNFQSPFYMRAVHYWIQSYILEVMFSASNGYTNVKEGPPR